MTTPPPLTSEQLLEEAPLDALAMLDDYGAALFTRSFHQATPALRHEIREIQAAVAGDTTLLPPVEPGPALRERTIAAVMQRAVTDAAPAPLATIGPAAGGVRMRPPTRVQRLLGGQMWRAASFLLIGALLVSLFFNLRLLERIGVISDAALNHRADLRFEEIVGRDAVTLANDPHSRRILLQPQAPGVHAVGYVLIGERHDATSLLVLGVPPGTSLTITARDSEGEILSRTVECRSFVTGLPLQLRTDEAARLASAVIEVRRLDGTLLLARA
ncbi:MAG: hypothetical protein KF817_05545 [Phycisphaeraceae bacterium]|nr:hypothetical protein [Phycisphaeraceae bacterium]